MIRTPGPRLVVPALGACLLVLAAACPAAAANDRTVLVLHAMPAGPGVSCSAPDIAAFDCSSPATVSVGGGETIAAFLLLHDFDGVVAVQCRFDWPASWGFHGWQGQCAGNQVNAVVPSGAGSPELATAFDAITRSSTAAPIGWLTLVTGVPGCLSIEESTLPSGTHVVGLDNAPTPVPAGRRGAVCADQSGIDGCALGTQLRHSSWGAIKAGFEL